MVGLLLKNWQLVVIALLLASLAATGVYVKFLKSNIIALEAEAASLTVKLQVSNASIATLQKSIDEQNTAVQKFKEAADARAQVNLAEILKAKAESANQKKRADSIMVRVIPQNTSACDAANQLFNEEISGAK